MDITEFKTLVAAYGNRDLASFVQGTPTVDLLLRAINNAKKWAQRQLDFELARTTVKVQIDVVNGGTLVGAVDAVDPSTIVVVNRIEQAYVSYNEGAGYRPIDFMTKARWAARTKTRWECVDSDPTRTTGMVPASMEASPAIVQQGMKLFFFPAPTDAQAGTELTIALDVIQWMPDYTDIGTAGGVTTDFFLEYCSDWLLYRSLREVNFFLKDGQRVQVTEQMLADSWESVREWNGSINNFTNDASLD